MILFGTVCGIFAPQVMKMFSLSDTATQIGTLTLRLQCIAMPLLPVNFMAGVTYQVVGNKISATLLAVSRQGLFYIPAVLILPNVFQLLGVQMCQALADACAFVFAIPFTILFFKGLNRASAQAALSDENLTKNSITVRQVWDE